MKILRPDMICPSVTDIDLTRLLNKGLRGLLIDLDNTLVHWDRNEIDKIFFDWVNKAKSMGFRLCLVSNGLDRRVSHFGRILNVPAVGKALKPRRRAFRKGLDHLDLPPRQVAMIGDQLFTDVLGGNRLGLFTILISPLSDQELHYTKLVRKIERLVLKRMVERGWVDKKTLMFRDGGKKR